MSTYVIGDVQGCFDALQKLLTLIAFSEADTVWFTGDLVNRGDKSLDVLRFVKSLGARGVTVLGNHDLHLLSVYFAKQPLYKGDTLEGVLHAEDAASLMDWLRHQPLLHYDAAWECVLTHAGIAPCWSLEKAMLLSHEVEDLLRGEAYETLLSNMYGNEPNLWRDDLHGMDRLRCIINYFTRMRFCEADGRLNLTYKGELHHAPAALMPWFAVPHRHPIPATMLFGHWASLNGETGHADIIGLDTGCVWGGFLTALRLEDRVTFKCRVD